MNPDARCMSQMPARADASKSSSRRKRKIAGDGLIEEPHGRAHAGDRRRLEHRGDARGDRPVLGGAMPITGVKMVTPPFGSDSLPCNAS